VPFSVKTALKTGMAAIAGGVGALMGGCVIGGNIIYHVDDPFQFFAHAASHGGIAIMVVGDPYPNRGAQVGAALAAAFDRTFASLNNPFRVAEPSADPVSKVVVLFNASNELARNVCADPTKIATAPTGARMKVRALYCGDGPYSEYSMSFFPPSSPEDEKFSELMRQLAYNAVPRERDPARRH
jgi:hypothetical protein